MKLYITVNRPIPSGYTGIDISKQKINFDDMDSICEQAESTEIIIEEVLSYVPIDKLGSLLQNIISRLRKNGKIIIQDVDFNEAIKLYQNGRANINDMNYLLYGQGALNKCGTYSSYDIRGVVEKLGLTIISLELTAGHYTLIAQRT